MPDEYASIRESNDTDSDTYSTQVESTTPPWITRILTVVCGAVFLGLAAQNDYESWDTLSMFGYLPADFIWDGSYWALITSAFVHFALWHVAFNVYWLWVLGSRVERAIGSLQYIAFIAASAFVSSSFQLAASDDVGIGASGVVYALFGFMWFARKRYMQFNEALNAKTIQVFVVWLVGCVVASYLEVWEVGNAAHISGILFGAAVAYAFIHGSKTRLAYALLTTLVILSVVPLFWCPWSVTWLGHKAYNAHVAERYDVALVHYSHIIQIDPDNAWAYLNRSYLYQALGQPDKAQSDLQIARSINPSIEEVE